MSAKRGCCRRWSTMVTCAVALLWAVSAMLSVPETCLAKAVTSASRTADDQPPPFAAVRAIVEKVFAKDKHYRPGDLVLQSQVRAVLGDLKTAGWEVAESRKLLARVPADSEYFVRALRTPKGVAFMRRIASMPGGYDRTDRLSRIPNGQQTLEKLIEGPDGHKLIGYLAEARGGKELGGMLGRTAQGADFNEPTGRIYTAKQLLAELERLHTAAARQAVQ